MRKNEERVVIRTSEDQLQRSLRHIDLRNLMPVLRVDKDLPVGDVDIPPRIDGYALASSLRERLQSP